MKILTNRKYIDILEKINGLREMLAQSDTTVKNRQTLIDNLLLEIRGYKKLISKKDKIIFKLKQK